MTTVAILRAGAWPAVVGLSGTALLMGAFAVAFPVAGTALLPIAFTLLAAAAAFALDEPAAAVVDVTPTGPVRRTGIRALALLAPIGAGALLILAGALRRIDMPWGAVGLAMVGNVVLGFAVASVARTRVGEPGAAVSAGVVLLLVATSLLPAVAGRVSTFPDADGTGLRSTTTWWIVLGACVVAVAGSLRQPASSRSTAWTRRGSSGVTSGAKRATTSP